MRKSMIFYYEWMPLINSLPDDKRLVFYDVLFGEKKQENHEINDAHLRAILSFVQKKVEENEQKYDQVIEKRRDAGRRGGVAKASKTSKSKQMLAKPSKAKQNLANLADNVNDNDNDNVNDNVNVNEININAIELLNDLAKILGVAKPRGTSDQIKKLKKQLKSFTDEDLKGIARALAADEFMCGKNKDNKRYATLSYILNRSQSKLSEWLEVSDNSQPDEDSPEEMERYHALMAEVNRLEEEGSK